jgi:hypothetical protein
VTGATQQHTTPIVAGISRHTSLSFLFTSVERPEALVVFKSWSESIRRYPGYCRRHSSVLPYENDANTELIVCLWRKSSTSLTQHKNQSCQR